MPMQRLPHLGRGVKAACRSRWRSRSPKPGRCPGHTSGLSNVAKLHGPVFLRSAMALGASASCRPGASGLRYARSEYGQHPLPAAPWRTQLLGCLCRLRSNLRPKPLS